MTTVDSAYTPTIPDDMADETDAISYLDAASGDSSLSRQIRIRVAEQGK
ncbi:hypothetical protein [Rhodococcus sp. USK13]|nr:hypothetical protein [Rhodococcus sp. USK13]